MTPWQWQPSKRGHFDALGSYLEKDSFWQRMTTPYKRKVDSSLKAEERWLYVPFANTTHCADEVAARRCFMLAAWTLANDPSLEVDLSIDSPLRCWTPRGPVTVQPGTYTADMVRQLFGELPKWATLDPCADSIATSEAVTSLLAVDGSRWWSDSIETRIAEFPSLLPECAAWIANVVTAIIPRRGPYGRRSSGSDPRFPGVIWIDLRDPEFMYEGIVHEAAHLYFDLQERIAPLTFESDAVFVSPLRSEPRTLRSVLLAYHALAYIGAIYYSLRGLTTISPRRVDAELIDTRDRLKQADQSLQQGRVFLTAAGSKFYERTQTIAAAIM